MALAQWMLKNPGPKSPESRTAMIGKRQMHYLRAGSGPDLIFLHGVLGAAENWRPVMGSLAIESTVYAIDDLNLGQSERAPGLDPSLSAAADRVIAFMNSTGIRAADLCGTSHGGAVAMMVAARNPERVRSLVLHAPVNPYSNLADPIVHFYRSALGRWFARRVPHLSRRLQSLALGRLYGDSARIPSGELDGYIASLSIPGTIEHVLRILDGWFADMRELEHALNSIRSIPTLLLWGTKDRAVSLDSGYVLQKHFDRAEMVVIPGAGHLPFEEVPAVFAGAVLRFLRGLDNRERAHRGNQQRTA